MSSKDSRDPATAEGELAGFIAKFAPTMQDQIRACRARMVARFPDAVQLVYDNYNFLVIGFGPTNRPSEAVFSLAAHARGVNLCFLQHGADLPDPTGILQGTGKIARHVKLAAPEELDRPDVGEIIAAACRLSDVPMETSVAGELIIKSVSAKQRPRQ
jgi:hypothetical protein